ncbi:MAG: pyrroline-5-carboxylate reductase [Gammaproteobacteria bacterium]
MTKSENLLLVGGGNMGRALVNGWLANGHESGRIQVVDLSEDARVEIAKLGVTTSATLGTAPDPVDLVMFAVKPQQLESVLPSYGPLCQGGSVVLSIAAGKRIDFFERILGPDVALVRAMPNTPAAIGQGMTVLTANESVSSSQKTLCESLMRAVGDVAWLDDEDLMDAVTAVSGSGPAYVFLLIECLTDAAVAAGLDEGLARQLAEQTISGAGAYAISSASEARELRRQVTSPGGTTEAALDVLMGEGGLPALMRHAVSAATERGRELA